MVIIRTRHSLYIRNDRGVWAETFATMDAIDLIALDVEVVS